MFNLIKKSIHLHLVRQGFTLLEVMIATLIIGIGLVGVSSLIVQNAQVQYINKNVLIASQLAQEGLELVRNVRDTNWLTTGNDWKTGDGVDLDTDIVQDGDYAIDYLGNIYDIDDSNGNGEIIDEAGARLLINSGYYEHSAGNVTPFFRAIKVVEDAGGNFLTVTCTIRSVERGRHNDYAAETILYDWR